MGAGGVGPAGRGSVTGTDPTDRPAERLDRLFEVLADERRRRVLYYLRGSDDPPASVDALAERIADADGLPAERVATSLHHTHLPKLDESGVVAFDPRSGAVRWDGVGGLLADCLDGAAEVERRPDPQARSE